MSRGAPLEAHPHIERSIAEIKLCGPRYIFAGSSNSQEQFTWTMLRQRPNGVKWPPISGEGAHVTQLESNKAKGHSGQPNVSRLEEPRRNTDLWFPHKWN